MDYVSIDLETTGLDPNTRDILEFAAVLDTIDPSSGVPVTPVDRLPYFRAVIVQETYRTDAYCAALHKKLWEEIKAVDKGRIQGEGHYLGRWDGRQLHEDLERSKGLAAYEQFGPLTHYTEPQYAIGLFIDWLRDQGITKSIYPAGKNFGSFDLQFLKPLVDKTVGERLPFKHRAFDPGSMYFSAGDTELPDLTKCLERAGLQPDSLHTALGDARDVVRLIRFKTLGQV